MRVRVREDNEVEAVQWTEDNLREVQDFMFPKSPLVGGGGGVSMGIYVRNNLQFIKKGDWIINTGNDFEYLNDNEFHNQYEFIESVDDIPF